MIFPYEVVFVFILNFSGTILSKKACQDIVEKVVAKVADSESI